MPLTDAQCRAAKPRARQYTLTDSDGLELLVTPAGTKIWRFRYRLGKDRPRITLGRYPAMKLAAARAAAAKHRTQLWAGEDPGTAEVARRSASESLADVVESYITEALPNLKPNTRLNYRASIKTFSDWARSVGIRRAVDLTPSALLTFRAHAISRPRRVKAKGGSRHDTTFAKGKRTPNAINAELRAIRTMLQALRKAGRLPSITTREHIIDNLDFVSVDHVKATPLRPSQLRDILAACQRYDADHDRSITPIVVLVMLSGMRIGEALRLTWDDIDLEDQTIRVVPGKTGRERTVDLSVSPALARLLGSMPRHGLRVFDGHSKKTTGVARKALISDYGAPAFLFSTRFSRPGERSAPTLRSTCGCYLTCAPGIFGAASIYMSAAQLGHSVQVAEKHYLGAVRRIPSDATTIEEAMQIASRLGVFVSPRSASVAR